MLKKYLIAVCGTITGLCITGGVVFMLVMAAIGSVTSTESGTVNDNSILYINLSDEVFDYRQETDVITMLQEGISNAPSFIDMISAVRRSASDTKIKAIYIESAMGVMGSAQREELVDALRQFKASGKPIYAYSDNYSQGDYLLASVADHIYLNPVGTVDIHGVGMTVPFFTGLLEKLGVKVQVVKVGSFKSAVEPYILKEMSDSSRLQSRQLVDSIWQYYTDAVARNRRLKPAFINDLADSLLVTYTPEQTLETGVVTALKYRREVEAELRKLTDTKSDDELPLVSPADYMAFYASEYAQADEDHVALYFAEGDIVDEGQGGIVSTKMVPEIIALADDEHVKGMVFRVNSGGGSAFASEQIWEALEYFKSKNKPLYVSMGDYAASGGYYISCGADRIYADATTLTGSIGVFGLIPDFSGLVTDKLGITFSHVNSGPNADFISVTEPMTPFQAEAMQRNVENTYSTFVGRVAKGRDIPEEEVRRIAEGRVWVGSRALELKLVDEIGGLQTALSAMLKKCSLDSYDYRNYPESSDSFWEELLRQSANLNAGLNSGMVRFNSESLSSLILLEQLRNQNPVQARMEPIKVVY